MIPIFPGSGTHSIGGGSYIIQYLKHLTLPALSLAAFEIATFARYARSGLLEVLSEDYIRTAASKGLPFMTVFLRHGLRNAVTTVVTMLGFRLRTLIAGAVVIETVFNWPGMGSLFLQGLKANDYPLLMAYTLVFATAIILSNLLVDISYALIDPRVTYD
ncbi:ABC transporter permease [Candidatus Bipolaricaulota bacterium]|nr:ABC transporter permease [Candidatus Bipolaricaulota bacterium]